MSNRRGVHVDCPHCGSNVRVEVRSAERSRDDGSPRLRGGTRVCGHCESPFSVYHY